jgi:hypothetical protein
MEWQPISEPDFSTLLSREMAQLDEEGRRVLEIYGIDRSRMHILRQPFDGSPAVPEPIFVLARSGPLVLFYDDVEEEFGTGMVDDSNTMRHWGTYGRLQWALRGLARKISAAE